MKKIALTLALALGLSSPSFAWDMWETFKSQSLSAGRIIDHSDKRLITTSEGESYGMFFALVADDRPAFEAMLKWTENNLSNGDITKRLPSWLWGGENGHRGPWKILDTNNAMDSDMWIAYCLLEAGRLWDRPDYRAKGLAMLELIKNEVRTVPNLGMVLLPGRVGFETQKYVKLNPSYYPLFLLRRFAMEDPYWEGVFAGSLRMLLRSAPNGYSPDWVSFDKSTGKVIPVDPSHEEALGSYNSIRVYLWAGITSPNDKSFDRLKAQFAPMVQTTLERRYVPEKVNVYTLEMSDWGPRGFAACLLPMLGQDKTASLFRSKLMGEPLIKENYYGNVLTLFAVGFDQGRYAFDANGYVYFPKKPLEAPVNPYNPAANAVIPGSIEAPDAGANETAGEHTPIQAAESVGYLPAHDIIKETVDGVPAVSADAVAQPAPAPSSAEAPAAAAPASEAPAASSDAAVKPGV